VLLAVPAMRMIRLIASGRLRRLQKLSLSQRKAAMTIKRFWRLSQDKIQNKIKNSNYLEKRFNHCFLFKIATTRRYHPNLKLLGKIYRTRIYGKSFSLILLN
jgi:hypothetical protein